MRFVLFLAAALAGALVLVPASTGAAGRPDLRIVRFVDPPEISIAGTEFSTAVTTRNAGRRKARSSRVGFFLSPDAGRGRHTRDYVLGERSVPRLRPGSRTTGHVRLRVPDNVPDGEYFVLYCADVDEEVRERREGNNCVASAYTTLVRRLGG